MGAFIVSSAFGQWHWDPKEGWVSEGGPRAIAEANPPAAVPRYFETPTDGQPGAPEHEYYEAYRLYEANQFERAASRFRRLARTHADDPHWAPRALFLRAECWYQAGHPYTAYRVLDEMLTRFPGAPNYRLALQREFEIATLYLHGRYRNVLGVPIIPGPATARRILTRIHEQDPNGPLGDDCLAALGDLEFRRGNYEEAQFQYDLLLVDYPRSPFVAQAAFRSACSLLFRQNGPAYDQGLLMQAAAGFERFVRLFPDAPEVADAERYLKQCRVRLAAANLDIARFYEKHRLPESARLYYRRVMEEYPETPGAAEAARRLAEMSGEEPPRRSTTRPAASDSAPKRRFWPFGSW